MEARERGGGGGVCGGRDESWKEMLARTPADVQTLGQEGTTDTQAIVSGTTRTIHFIFQVTSSYKLNTLNICRLHIWDNPGLTVRDKYN